MSKFDGNVFQLFGYQILGFMITLFSFGICFPWAITLVLNWETKHTIIDGQRLYFDGNALKLFGMWIKWMFLIVLTGGIYLFWVNISMKKWKVSHTHILTK